MKIITIIGARPQFVKAAVVSKEIRKKHKELFIHTGQHYDTNMSENFFEELNIPRPDYHLNIGSGEHSEQTGKMLIEIQTILASERPDAVLVYGDTNSTLAGALAAVKMDIPIIHVEAGLRSYNKKMPEEINRVLTDHMSALLLCPTQNAIENLKLEGITQGVYEVGDIMCDSARSYAAFLKSEDRERYINHFKQMFCQQIIRDSQWYVATIHRAENTDTIDKLIIILSALEELPYQVIFPVHPRIGKFVDSLMIKNDYKNIVFIEPVGYMDMLFLIKNAIKVITDSGGVQKESYVLETPCVTIREETEWLETLTENCNILVSLNKTEIKKCILEVVQEGNYDSTCFGFDSAKRICEVIERTGFGLDKI